MLHKVSIINYFSLGFFILYFHKKWILSSCSWSVSLEYVWEVLWRQTKKLGQISLLISKNKETEDCASLTKTEGKNKCNMSKERSRSYSAKEIIKTMLNLSKKSYVWLNFSLWFILRNHFPPRPGMDILKDTCLLLILNSVSVRYFKAITVVAIHQYVYSLQISNWLWNNSTQSLIYTLWLWVCILNKQYFKIYAYTYKHANPAS